MSEKLTVEILSANKVKLNEQYTTLVLEGQEPFTVGIKELQDALGPLTTEMDQLNKEISATYEKLGDGQQQQKIDELAEQARSRIASGGHWTAEETYDGRTMRHAEVSMHENFKQHIRRLEQQLEAKQQQLTELKERKTLLEGDYSDVRWAWHLSKKRSNERGGINEALGRGKTTQTLKLGPHVQGGGFVWLEPFHEAAGATGSTTNGIFVQSLGTPAVTLGEWYAANESGKPVKIEEAIQPGLKVQLHIYTEAMYGHNIQVELKADGKTLKANTYSNQLLTSSDVPGQTVVVQKEEREIVDAENRFFAEVEIYDCSLPDAIPPPAEAVSGYLLHSGEDEADGVGTRILNVQKAVLECYIDPAWCADKEAIRIIPTVYFGKGESKRLNAAVLEVHKPEPDTELEIPDTGNKPVFVDAVETNFESFHPCRYDKITARVGASSALVTIFDSKGTTENADQLIFPLVVGNDSAKKDVEIIVENATTSECFYAGSETAHTGKVIDTGSLETQLVTGTETPSSQVRGADVEDYLSGGEKKAKTSRATNKLKFVNGISSITVQDGFKILEKHSAAEFQLIADEKVKMKLGYDYTFGGTVQPLIGLCKTFWPNNEAISVRYPMILRTCAYQKQLEVLAYPDSKWTIQLGFNYDKGKFNAVQREYHQAWTLTRLEAEEEQRRLADKREGAAANIERYADQKRRAPQNQKGPLQGQIDQQRRKEASYSRRIEEQQQLIDEGNQRTSAGGRLAEAWDSAYSADALQQGLVDCELGLIVEFDRPYGKLDLTSGYSEIIEFLKKLADIKDKAERIINGSDAEATQSAPRENASRSQNLKRKLDEKKAKNPGKASNWSFAFIPPSIGLSVGWYADRPTDLLTPVMGTMFEGVIDLNPVFGFEIKYDVYQLLYKLRHPAVLAVVATLDILDTALGDNFDIDLDLIVTSRLSGTLKGTLNTAEGSRASERLIKDADGSPARLKGAIDISLKGYIQANGQINTWVFGKYEAYGEVSMSVESGLSLEFVAKANEESFFLEPTIGFEGIVLKAQINAGAAAARGLGEPAPSLSEMKASSGVHYTHSDDIIIMDAYQWEMESWRVKLI